MAKSLVARVSWKSSLRLSSFVTFATGDRSNRQGFPYMNGVRRLMESVGSASFKMKSLAIPSISIHAIHAEVRFAAFEALQEESLGHGNS